MYRELLLTVHYCRISSQLHQCWTSYVFRFTLKLKWSHSGAVRVKQIISAINGQWHGYEFRPIKLIRIFCMLHIYIWLYLFIQCLLLLFFIFFGNLDMLTYVIIIKTICRFFPEKGASLALKVLHELIEVALDTFHILHENDSSKQFLFWYVFGKRN